MDRKVVSINIFREGASTIVSYLLEGEERYYDIKASNTGLVYLMDDQDGPPDIDQNVVESLIRLTVNLLDQ